MVEDSPARLDLRANGLTDEVRTTGHASVKKVSERRATAAGARLQCIAGAAPLSSQAGAAGACTRSSAPCSGRRWPETSSRLCEPRHTACTPSTSRGGAPARSGRSATRPTDEEEPAGRSRARSRAVLCTASATRASLQVQSRQASFEGAVVGTATALASDVDVEDCGSSHAARHLDADGRDVHAFFLFALAHRGLTAFLADALR